MDNKCENCGYFKTKSVIGIEYSGPDKGLCTRKYIEVNKYSSCSKHTDKETGDKCANCIYFRKKVDEINVNYEGTDEGMCLKHVSPINENYLCGLYVNEKKELKCKRCGKEIKFAIYKPKEFYENPIYADDSYCLDCHKWMQEQMDGVFNLFNIQNLH